MSTPIPPSPIPSYGAVPSAPAPADPPGVFLGRIAAVENGPEGKTAVVDFALGRFRIPLEGDFAKGDLLRLVFVDSALRLERAANPLSPVWQQAGSVLPGVVPLLQDLASFEASLLKFLAGAGPQRPAPATGSQAPLPPPPGLPASPAGIQTIPMPASGPGMGSAAPAGIPAGPPAALLAGALPPEASPVPNQALPSLIGQVLDRPGGRELLAAALGKMGSEALRIVTASLAYMAPPADAEGQRSFMNLIQGFRVALAQAENQSPSRNAGAAGMDPGRELQRYMRPAPGSDLFPGRGLVLERTEAAPRTAGGASPLYQYRIDLGGALLEAQSAQKREPGEFVAFHLEREGRGLRFREPELPPSLRAAYAEAPPALKTALGVAADFLGDPALPGFAPAAKDFAALLSESGRLQAGSTWPAPKELEDLFRLMLAFPRDAENPGLQAKVWGEAARENGGLEAFLRLLRPADSESAALGPKASLRFSEVRPESPGQEALLQALSKAAGGKTEIRWDALLETARALAAGPSAPEGFSRPAGAEKFLLQALAVLAPREEEWREGQPRSFQFYHGDAWHPADASWSRVEGKAGRSRGSKEPALQVDIAARGDHLGAVEVRLRLEPGRSRLEFRNQGRDAQALLAESLAPLEQLLARLDYRLDAWTYARLPPEAEEPAGVFPPLLPLAAPSRPGLDLRG